MKHKLLVFAICTLLFTGFVCLSTVSLKAPAITSCFIFGDVTGGY